MSSGFSKVTVPVFIFGIILIHSGCTNESNESVSGATSQQLTSQVGQSDDQGSQATKLADDNKALRAENMTLLERVSELQEEVGSLGGKLSVASESTEATTSTATEDTPVSPDETLKKENMQLMEQVQQLEGELESVNSKLAAATDSSAAIGSDGSSADEALKAKNMELTEQVEQLQGEVESLGNKLAASSAEAMTSAAESTETAGGESDNNAIQGVLDAANQKVDELTDVVANMTEERNSLKSMMDAISSEKGELNTKIQGLMSEHSAIGDAAGNISSSVNTLYSRFVASGGGDEEEIDDDPLSQKLSSYSGRLTQVVAALDTSSSSSTGGSDDSVAQLAGLSSDLNQARSRISQLESVESDLTGQVEMLTKTTEQMGELTSKLGSAEEQVISLETQVSDLTNDRDTLKTELVNLQGAVENLSNDKSQTEELLRGSKEALANLSQEKEQLNKEKEQLQNEISSLNAKIKDQKLGHEVKVESLERETTLIRIGNEIAYRFGSIRLNDDGKQILDIIADLLNESPDRVVSLEGHTDDVPVVDGHRRYATNWELSSARAARAARYLMGKGIDQSRVRVVGFADSRPIADNESEEGRAKNRRLEVRLVPGKWRETVKNL